MKKAQLGFTPIEPSDSSNFNINYDAIKAKFIAGKYVSVSDYPKPQHRVVISVVTKMRCKLIIVSGWIVARQRYLSEIKTICDYLPHFLVQKVVI